MEDKNQLSPLQSIPIKIKRKKKRGPADAASSRLDRLSQLYLSSEFQYFPVETDKVNTFIITRGPNELAFDHDDNCSTRK